MSAASVARRYTVTHTVSTRMSNARGVWVRVVSDAPRPAPKLAATVSFASFTSKLLLAKSSSACSSSSRGMVLDDAPRCSDAMPNPCVRMNAR